VQRRAQVNTVDFALTKDAAADVEADWLQREEDAVSPRRWFSECVISQMPNPFEDGKVERGKEHREHQQIGKRTQMWRAPAQTTEGDRYDHKAQCKEREAISRVGTRRASSEGALGCNARTNQHGSVRPRSRILCSRHRALTRGHMWRLHSAKIPAPRAFAPTLERFVVSVV